ncbi:MAG: DUF4430 domain-containing protein [Agathobacter sp.]|nr:DUF4430 domain-containing protein [Agathobacter sp.]
MQKKFRNTRFTSLLLCMMLTVAVALTTIGCADNKADSTTSTESQSVSETADTQAADDAVDTESTDDSADAQDTEAAADTPADAESLGEGAVQFTFTVVDADGNETNFDIHTDAETVGAALLEQNLIAGDDSEYGLYVKTVNGITADYDTDGTYWAFYVNGEYAMTGVDSTPVEDGAAYAFKVEK